MSTLQALLREQPFAFELLVVDQSDNDVTEQALSPFREDRRFRYFRLAQPGKSRALNRALQEARGEILALTDDDCVPKPSWLSALTCPLFHNPAIGGVFGRVVAAPHDAQAGYIPECLFERPVTITQVSEVLQMPHWGNYGIGACMAVRRDRMQQLGGWDPCIGPGSRFDSGDDHDLALRLLEAGAGLHFCPKAEALHFGLRAWDTLPKDMRRWGISFGVVFAKHLRCGMLYNGSLRILRHYARQALGRALRLKRPSGLAFVLGWIRGFFLGLRHPLDRPTFSFKA